MPPTSFSHAYPPPTRGRDEQGADVIYPRSDDLALRAEELNTQRIAARRLLERVTERQGIGAYPKRLPV